jgi:hypothetical protein
VNIVVSDNSNITTITEYFDFNQISYTKNSLWDANLDQGGRYALSDELVHNDSTLLILDYDTFTGLCSEPTSLTQLIKFCSNTNKIWVWSNIDGLIVSIVRQSILLSLDRQVISSCITVFVDGEFSDYHPLAELKNIQFKIFPYNFFLRQHRIQNAVVDKSNCSRDFMLTTVKKSSRPHREILWNQLTAIPGLVDYGHVNYGSGQKRIGQQALQHGWADGYPSMDLYRDSWLELVPETLYHGGYYVTEKTTKPIATKTPFLTVSTQYYLEYLKKLGFRTFGNIIDEVYDQQSMVEDRIQLMLLQLQDIVENGAESFYNECASVLEHNQNRLFEISGRSQFEMDLFIAENLEQVGIA